MERDFEEIEEQETTTPRTHDRGEITGKPVHAEDADEATSEPLTPTAADIPPRD
jgi:hypothetical protein